jgi:hypothetical protein
MGLPEPEPELVREEAVAAVQLLEEAVVGAAVQPREEEEAVVEAAAE